MKSTITTPMKLILLSAGISLYPACGPSTALDVETTSDNLDGEELVNTGLEVADFISSVSDFPGVPGWVGGALGLLTGQNSYDGLSATALEQIADVVREVVTEVIEEALGNQAAGRDKSGAASLLNREARLERPLCLETYKEQCLDQEGNSAACSRCRDDIRDMRATANDLLDDAEKLGNLMVRGAENCSNRKHLTDSQRLVFVMHIQRLGMTRITAAYERELADLFLQNSADRNVVQSQAEAVLENLECLENEVYPDYARGLYAMDEPHVHGGWSSSIEGQIEVSGPDDFFKRLFVGPCDTHEQCYERARSAAEDEIDRQARSFASKNFKKVFGKKYSSMVSTLRDFEGNFDWPVDL